MTSLVVIINIFLFPLTLDNVSDILLFFIENGGKCVIIIIITIMVEEILNH